MAEIKVDVTGQTCPIPLVQTRLALKKSVSGDIIEIKGDNPVSREEIKIAASALSVPVLSDELAGDVWTIRLQK